MSSAVSAGMCLHWDLNATANHLQPHQDHVLGILLILSTSTLGLVIGWFRFVWCLFQSGYFVVHWSFGHSPWFYFFLLDRREGVCQLSSRLTEERWCCPSQEMVFFSWRVVHVGSLLRSRTLSAPINMIHSTSSYLNKQSHPLSQRCPFTVGKNLFYAFIFTLMSHGISLIL